MGSAIRGQHLSGDVVRVGAGEEQERWRQHRRSGPQAFPRAGLSPSMRRSNSSSASVMRVSATGRMQFT